MAMNLCRAAEIFLVLLYVVTLPSASVLCWRTCIISSFLPLKCYLLKFFMSTHLYDQITRLSPNVKHPEVKLQGKWMHFIIKIFFKKYPLEMLCQFSLIPIEHEIVFVYTLDNTGHYSFKPPLICWAELIINCYCNLYLFYKVICLLATCIFSFWASFPFLHYQTF